MLIIAEKPDLGKAIAGGIKGPRNYDVDKQLITCQFGENDVTIVWCFGHLLELYDPEDYDEKYKEWRLDDLPIYFDNWKHKPRAGKDGPDKGIEERVALIGSLLKACDVVVNAGDIDDEGQLLIDELLRYHNYTGPALRLNTNDTSAEAMSKALNSMQDNASWVQSGISAYGRQLSDKVFGYNLTRYYTLINGGKRTLPVGRVKMPTLGLVVRRDRQIEGHKKSFYYGISANVEVDGNIIPARYVPSPENPHLVEGKFLDKEYVTTLAGQIKGSSLSPTHITKHLKLESPPLPFNQTKLYTFCAQKWDLQPAKVARITQNLRDKHKAITYNRSDCQYLSTETHAEAPRTLPIVCKNMGLDTMAFDTSIKSRCFNNDNLTAHTAIIPTCSEQDLSQFTQDEKKVYDIIARYYLIQFMPPAKKEVTKLAGNSVEGGTIEATYTNTVSPGYLSLLDGFIASSDEDEKQEDPALEAGSSADASALDKMKEGDYSGLVKDTSVREQETRPPAYYTPASLVNDMSSIAKYVENSAVKQILLRKDEGKKGEHGSIGTPATRHIIVQDLVQRGYLVETKKGKKTVITSTPLGREFYDILPDSVRKVDVSAKWWCEQEQIRDGELSPEQMAKDVLKTVNAIIESGNGAMENASTYATGAIGEAPIGKCPQCGGNVYETAKGYRCVSNGCKFSVYKDNAFFRSIGKTITPKAMDIILKKGKIGVKNCKSKSGKTFDAVILCLWDKEEGYKFSFASDDELDTLGSCPKCGAPVVEKNMGFTCTGEGCKFIIWKKNRLFEALGRTAPISAGTAKELLKTGHAVIKGFVSKKTGNKYDKEVAMDTDGNFTFMEGFASSKSTSKNGSQKQLNAKDNRQETNNRGKGW